MRWWERFVLTLVMAPPIWWVVAGYVATQQGASVQQWLTAIPKVLSEVYLIYTLPAALLCMILYGLGRLLTLVSLDLFTVIVSPVVAITLAWGAVHYFPEPHVRAAGSSLPLFACYGLVWGLLIREPRRRPRDEHGDEEFVSALLP